MMRAGWDYLTRALKAPSETAIRPVVLPQALYDDMKARGENMTPFVRQTIPTKITK